MGAIALFTCLYFRKRADGSMHKELLSEAEARQRRRGGAIEVELGAQARAVDSDQTIHDFLISLKLDRYMATFEEEDIDTVRDLRALNEAQLEKLGIKMGPRTLIMKALGGMGPSAPPASQQAGVPLGLTKQPVTVAVIQAATQAAIAEFGTDVTLKRLRERLEAQLGTSLVAWKVEIRREAIRVRARKDALNGKRDGA